MNKLAGVYDLAVPQESKRAKHLTISLDNLEVKFFWSPNDPAVSRVFRFLVLHLLARASNLLVMVVRWQGLCLPSVLCIAATAVLSRPCSPQWRPTQAALVGQ
jgi:hypothetical protein